MDDLRTNNLPREVIADFIKSPRGVRSYEDLQGDTTNLYQAVASASFLTLTTEPTLGAERLLALSPDLDGDDGGANGTYTLGLADTTVVPGNYGGAPNLITITVDAKGRVTDLANVPIDTDDVPEGSTNLYYTNARARGAISAGAGITYTSGTGVVKVTSAGTYGAPTGTLARSAFATYSSPTISGPPTQAEVQAIADALQAVSRTLGALVTDLKTNGNLT
jgi:hypothetical protein